ncbi:hypothetical protein JCM1393_20680 [Clostridium carnis]
MRKQIFVLALLLISVLISCSKEDTFEKFFQKTMDKMHKGEKDFGIQLVI